MFQNDYKKISEYRNAICNDLQTNNFEWFCTLNLANYNRENVDKLLIEWARMMSKKDHIQIAYKGIMVFNSATGPHVHLLMLGRNRSGHTLLNRNEDDWKRAWNKLTKHNVLIEKVYDLEGAAGYMSRSGNTPKDLFELVTPYNTKLLKKTSLS